MYIKLVKFGWLIVTALTEALSSAILDCLNGRANDPFEAHECVRKLYTWQNVAERTEHIYNLVSAIDEPSLVDRLYRYRKSY